MAAIRADTEVVMARRIVISVLAVVALTVGSSVAMAQPRGGGGGGAPPGGGGRGGAWHGAPSGGGAWHGGGYHGDYHGDYHGGYHGWYGGWYGPSVGFYLGSPYWGSWPYYYPYGYAYPYGYTWPYGYGYSYPSPYVYAPREPSVYIEEAPQSRAVHSWYYCTDPAGYYPYVQRCAKPWMTVVPQDVPAGSAAPAPTEPYGGAGGSK
jgi:hypothetical protein